IYTAEVTDRLTGHDVEITHDYTSKEKAIPYPATLMILLGQQITTLKTGIGGGGVSLYSEYPFPWRQNNVTLNEFQQNALVALRENPGEPFYQFEEMNGQPVLRYARASILGRSCVDCNNTDPNSPVGDVRGVLEVTIPLSSVFSTAQQSVMGTSFLFGIILFVGLGTFGVFLRDIRRNTQHLEKQVDERTRQLQASETQLRQQNTELEQLHRDKDELLGIVAHDLRNPLTIISITSEMLQDLHQELSTEEIEKSTDSILRNTQRMLGIISRLLDISKIEAGQMNVDVKPTEIMAIIREMVTQQQVNAHEKQIQIETHYPKQHLIASIDPEVLKQILDNLFSNALKYSPAETTVTLSVVEYATAVQIVVKDQGQGLTDEDKTRLFGKFAKLSAQPTANEPSTGLGLYIVKQLVEVMEGEISAYSEGSGKGSQFILKLNKPPS
ncbi:MAG: ATP-binding protein, partial [Chloroflexota bacterium]